MLLFIYLAALVGSQLTEEREYVLKLDVGGGDCTTYTQDDGVICREACLRDLGSCTAADLQVSLNLQEKGNCEKNGFFKQGDTNAIVVSDLCGDDDANTIQVATFKKYKLLEATKANNRKAVAYILDNAKKLKKKKFLEAVEYSIENENFYVMDILLKRGDLLSKTEIGTMMSVASFKGKWRVPLGMLPFMDTNLSKRQLSSVITNAAAAGAREVLQIILSEKIEDVEPNTLMQAVGNSLNLNTKIVLLKYADYMPKPRLKLLMYYFLNRFDPVKLETALQAGKLAEEDKTVQEQLQIYALLQMGKSYDLIDKRGRQKLDQFKNSFSGDPAVCDRYLIENNVNLDALNA